MKNQLILKLYKHFLKASTVTTDSRICPEGSMFFALKGESFDGNTFALNALKMGCAVAVVDDITLKNKANCYYVPDVLEALQELANYHRKQFKIPVIGITGSNGKTTTKELIAAVLSKRFNTHFTKGNFNNHIGVPLTLLNLNNTHQMAVIEMGANHPGEIRELSLITEPDYGIITNIGKAHLEGFGSFEAVIKTKKELYDVINEKDGCLFVNMDNELLVSLLGKTKRIAYGSSSGEVIVSVENSFPVLNLMLKKKDLTLKVNTQLAGLYNLENIQAAVCIGNHFGVSPKDMASALEDYSPNNNRSQIKKTNNNTLLLDMYNANPTSMEAAIMEFQSSEFKNKVVILGDMKELGIYSDDEHKTILKKLDINQFSRLICIGNEFLKFAADFPKIDFFKNTSDALQVITKEPITNSTILLKGSRSLKLEDLVTVL